MKVLLSIKPEFASKIFDGSKKYEYRRIIFKNQEVNKIIVYATNPIKLIIGEFEVEDILYDDPRSLWTKTQNYAGINKEDFFKYFHNIPKGYAIKVMSTKMYTNPLSLNNFMISSPPQSFMYLQ